MKVYKLVIILSTLLFLMTGCIEADVSNDIKKSANKKFSYLNDLSEEEMEAYELFMEDKDISHLKDFSPEQIVLIYFDSVVKSDIAGIYSLTYDDGTLPELYEFEEKYYKEQELKDEDLAMKFRNYDSIAVKENAVNMKVSFGSISYSLFMEVKKDNEGWKVNMFHSEK